MKEKEENAKRLKGEVMEMKTMMEDTEKMNS